MLLYVRDILKPMFTFGGNKHEARSGKPAVVPIEEMTSEQLVQELTKLDHAISVFETGASVTAVSTLPRLDHSVINGMRARREEIAARLQN